MISEGSCDTDDWSNDAENSALQLYSFFFCFLIKSIQPWWAEETPLKILLIPNFWMALYKLHIERVHLSRFSGGFLCRIKGNVVFYIDEHYY